MPISLMLFASTLRQMYCQLNILLIAYMIYRGENLIFSKSLEQLSQWPAHRLRLVLGLCVGLVLGPNDTIFRYWRKHLQTNTHSRLI